MKFLVTFFDEEKKVKELIMWGPDWMESATRLADKLGGYYTFRRYTGL